MLEIQFRTVKLTSHSLWWQMKTLKMRRKRAIYQASFFIWCKQEKSHLSSLCGHSFQLWSQLWKGYGEVCMGKNTHSVARSMGIVELIFDLLLPIILHTFHLCHATSHQHDRISCLSTLTQPLLSLYAPPPGHQQRLSRGTINRNLFRQFFMRLFIEQIVTKIALELTCIFLL